MKPFRLVLFATYFPKPGNPMMGIWAMRQAQALLRNGVDLQVVSMTSWVPKLLAGVGRAGHWANCPPAHDWSLLHVLYPRWPFYQIGRLKAWDYRWPGLQHQIAWAIAGTQIQRIVQQFRPDLIYAHHTGVNGDIGRRLKRLFGIPYVVTDHDFGEIADCERYPGRRRFFEKVMRDASTMAPVSKRMAEDIRRLFPGVATTTVHYGTDSIPDLFFRNPRPPELVGKKVVFSAALLYTRKGMPALVKAFAKVASCHPDAVLRIVGDGQERAAVEAAIAEAGLAKRVTMLGTQPHARVLQEMAWCDVFALISWDEPFATVYLEALSAGRPIVCCDDGGINDVIQNEVHALTVPPKDVDAAAAALERILSDDEGRRRMGVAALELFQSRLTWDACAQALIRVFERVLGRSHAPARPATAQP